VKLIKLNNLTVFQSVGPCLTSSNDVKAMINIMIGRNYCSNLLVEPDVNLSTVTAELLLKFI